mmetsp:Transcript_77513/g.122147  ORF Transcript_77513/g.122147 Transcript_77513/m.122147 type:complete len:90 (+) Transcript_77513:2308-2577(+)
MVCSHAVLVPYMLALCVSPATRSKDLALLQRYGRDAEAEVAPGNLAICNVPWQAQGFRSNTKQLSAKTVQLFLGSRAAMKSSSNSWNRG